MPRTVMKKDEILEAMKRTDILATVPEKTREQWLEGFVDEDSGKRSGPLVRLLVYAAAETVMRENEWGGNSFLILVEGALDVFMMDAATGIENKVNEILPGESFGEMSLFAGVQRVATVVAAPSNSSREESLVLEMCFSRIEGATVPRATWTYL